MTEIVFIKKGAAVIQYPKSNFEKNEEILKKDGWFKIDPPESFLSANFEIEEEKEATKTKTSRPGSKDQANQTKTKK